jgi:hypothetical protein
MNVPTPPFKPLLIKETVMNTPVALLLAKRLQLGTIIL